MKEYEYSDELADIVRDFLEEDEWPYVFDAEKGLFKSSVRMRGSVQHLSLLVDVHEDEIISYAVFPVHADADDRTRLTEMALFLADANYGLKNGNFELDRRDGEIRYKSYINCDGALPVMQVIQDAVYLPVFSFQHYARGITDIVFCGASAEEAMEVCVQRSDSGSNPSAHSSTVPAQTTAHPAGTAESDGEDADE